MADPNPAVRKLLSVVFDSGRFRLTFASNGEEALGFALVEPPHLVIAEVRLERLDGISLCQRLKKHPRTSGARLLILTTSTSTWDMRRAARAGAEGYVTKPFSPSQLVRQVDGLLEGKGAELGEAQGATADRQSYS
ncbi:MAG: response regulator [Chloroflexota bacterium]